MCNRKDGVGVIDKVCYRGMQECADAMGISKDTLIKIVKNDPGFPIIITGPRNSIRLFPIKQIEEWLRRRSTVNCQPV